MALEDILNSRLIKYVQSMDIEMVEDVLRDYHKMSTGQLKFDIALIEAAKTGCADTVRVMLQYHGDVNFSDQQGKRALHHASLMGSLDSVNLLLQAGASVNYSDNDGVRPLHLAAEAGYVNVAAMLMSAGAHVTHSRTTNTNENPFHTACRYGHSDVVKLMIGRGTDLNVPGGTCANTPLHYAVQGSHIDILELLCLCGAELNLQDNFGRTPLHFAVEQCRNELVERLIHFGADPDQNTATNEEGPLHLLAGTQPHAFNVSESARARTAEFLVQHSRDLNVLDRLGNTPLHHTAFSGNQGIAKVLIEAGANLNLVEDMKHETALNKAIGFQRLKIAELLIQAGADVNIVDHSGSSPLHGVMACKSAQKLSVTRMLISNGAKLNDRTERGATPLGNCVFHFIVGMRSPEIQDVLEALVVAGVHLKHRQSVIDSGNRSPLCWLAWHGVINCAYLLVYAGWHLQSEQWIHLPGRDEKTNKFLIELRNLAKNPAALWCLARNKIRLLLNSSANDTTIEPLVNKLSVPNFIKKQLLLDDVIRYVRSQDFLDKL